MQMLDEEHAAIDATLLELSEEPSAPILHPKAAENYASMVGRLQETLGDMTLGETRAERQLVDAARGLIEKIVIMPVTQERGGPIDIVLHGTLARFMGEPEQPGNFGLGRVVAGGGLEPPTCGL
jgi:hypothetical protein